MSDDTNHTGDRNDAKDADDVDEAAEAEDESTLAERVEAEGIVDQQAMLLDQEDESA